MTEPTLYDRLGGVFAIAAVVDHFSDAVVQNPIVGQKSENPDLREWHTNKLGRLPGLKFMRTLWVCDIERHEALPDRAVMKGHRRRPVAAGRRS
jgi:hemoglobin